MTALRAVLLGTCLCACAGSVEPDGTLRVGPPREPTAVPAGTSNPEASPAPVVGSFADLPAPRFRESAINEAHPSRCRVTRRESTLEEARERGFDAYADRDAFTQTWQHAVFVSRERVTRATLNLRASIDRVWLIEGEPFDANASPAACPSHVAYDVLVELYTDDGSLAGAFIAEKLATPAGEEVVRALWADSDLRNFTGDMPVAWDGATRVFATASVSWTFESGAPEQFSFEMRWWASAGAGSTDHLSYGVGTTARGTFEDLQLDLAGYVDAPRVSTLGEFVDSLGSYQRNVTATVVAASPQAARAQVQARVDGAETSRTPIDLAFDWRRVTSGFVIGDLDLGLLDEGTSVELQARDIDGLGDLQLNVLVDGCPVTPAHDRCQAPGCTAAGALSVVSAGCDPVILD